MSRISLITVPYDSGHYGTRMGKGSLVLSGELISFFKKAGKPVSINEIRIDDLPFVTEITSVFELNRRLSSAVKNAKDNGDFPIILSGNCNSALGAISGCESNIGVVWMDCHGDFNTPETTIGGFLDGMALAILAGRCWRNIAHSIPGFCVVPEDKIFLVGARDLDKEEEEALRNSEVTIIPSQDVETLMRDADILKKNKQIYLHIDLDILDPAVVKVNGFGTPGGLSPDELKKTVIELKSRLKIAALTFASYDPSFDTKGQVSQIVKDIVKEFA